MPLQERRVTVMTAMKVRSGRPCSCRCPLKNAEIGGSALRVTAMTAVTGMLGYPCCHPSGEHPINAKCRREHYSPFSARKTTPASEKSPRFFRLRLQGVTHYTLQARSVCQTFLLDSLMVAGLRPAYPLLCASDTRTVSAIAVTVTGRGGYPKTAVITVTAVTPRTFTRRKKGEGRIMPYAILRFQKRKAGGVAACERHNERKKGAYKSNLDIDMEWNCQ